MCYYPKLRFRYLPLNLIFELALLSVTKNRQRRKRTNFLPSDIDKQCDEEDQSQTESEDSKQEERIPRAAFFFLIHAVCCLSEYELRFAC